MATDTRKDKVDENDIDHIKRLFGEPVQSLACPVQKNGKINPHVSRFLLSDGRICDVFHVKPIYYETTDNKWRPLSEITTTHGNSDIKLNKQWRNASARYINWLGKRQKLLG